MKTYGFPALGTQWTLLIDHDQFGTREEEAILTEVQTFENRFSRFIPASEVNRFREATPGAYEISERFSVMLSRALLLRELTRPDDVLVVSGHDWNSMFPHFAQRRALMIRTGEVRDTPNLRAGLANLRSEKIGALALADATDHSFALNYLLVEHGLDPRPLCRWRNMSVYVPSERRAESARLLRQRQYPDVEWTPEAEPPAERLAGEWFETTSLGSPQREIFSTMTPEPVRFMATYGPGLDRTNTPALFGAHPVTRLVFRLPAGTHTLRTVAIIKPDTAYDPNLHRDRTTDGVEISLWSLRSGERAERLFGRLLDPRANPADRGPQPLAIPFTLSQAGEVELFVGSGPNGRDTCDWLYFEPLILD